MAPVHTPCTGQYCIVLSVLYSTAVYFPLPSDSLPVLVVPLFGSCSPSWDLVGEGWVAPYDENDWRSGRCLGQHGFDNQLASMRAIFLGRGPRFAPGRSIPTLMNVEVSA